MLTLRQQKIIDLLPKCEVLADVGCDHGYIGAQAIIEKLAQNVVFIDVSSPSLDKAKSLCNKLGINSNASFYCQDGLKQIKCDCAVIAGIGGKETIQILKDTAFLPQNLILQPMKNIVEVRNFVVKDYKIVTDTVFFDKKYYNLLRLTRGQDKLSQEQLLFGKTNLENYQQDFIDYLHKEIEKCQTILSRYENNETKQKLLLLTYILKKGENING